MWCYVTVMLPWQFLSWQKGFVLKNKRPVWKKYCRQQMILWDQHWSCFSKPASVVIGESLSRMAVSLAYAALKVVLYAAKGKGGEGFVFPFLSISPQKVPVASRSPFWDPLKSQESYGLCRHLRSRDDTNIRLRGFMSVWKVLWQSGVFSF